MKRILTLFFGVVFCLQLSAQQRYVDEIFAEVQVTDSVVYGTNVSIITGTPMDQDLIMDVYEPVGDTVSNRPLILLLPSGNFLPRIVNGSYNGTIKDSANVEMCKRFARMGYVAASVFYRQGWNPLSADQLVRTSTILQASYRGIQDTRTCIRYFRKEAAENENPYAVDVDRIMVGGVGTGGYMSLGAAYFDDYQKVVLTKFIDFSQTPPVPVVDTNLHGNIEGTNTTPLNKPNHVGYSSDFNMVFQIGGALGDTSWIDPGDMPVVTFHVPSDPNAPYMIGDVIVPTTGGIVIDSAAGGYTIAQISNDFGNQDVFKEAGFNDAFTQAANSSNDGFVGLFPFNRPVPDAGSFYDCANAGVPVPGQFVPTAREGNPWEWWNEAQFVSDWDAATGGQPAPGVIVNCSQRAGSPTMSAEQGRTYIDSIVGYLMPRAALVLDLPVDLTPFTTSIDNDLKTSLDFAAYPNPAQDRIRLIANSAIQSISLMDITGRVVRRIEGIRSGDYTLERAGLSNGLYLLQVDFKEGSISEKLIFTE